MTRKRTHG